MKKSLLFLGLLTSAVCLTACGSKDFNMSFEEALEIANHSELQDILAKNDNFEQNFNIVGSYNNEWTEINVDITTDSKQSINNKNSELSTKFDANITSSGETINVNWAMDFKVISDTLYLSLSNLNLTGSEDLWLIAMMTEWFKNQWFFIPMSGLSNVPNTFSMLKDSKELNDKNKDIIINEWPAIYSWRFTQFNGYNTRKFSLDNEKLNEIIKEYYNTVYSGLDEELFQEIPALDIQNFEWYLVMSWKDKVTSVIENMDINENDIIMNTYWFAGEDYEFYVSEWEETLIAIKANKKGSKYDIYAKITDSISLNWTITPKLSKSSVNLKFDATLTMEAESESWADTVIPFNGSWRYNPISTFTTTAPEGAQDLMELLWSYLGGMMWWDDYDYEDYDYEDYDYEDYDYEDYDYEDYGYELYDEDYEEFQDEAA